MRVLQKADSREEIRAVLNEMFGASKEAYGFKHDSGGTVATTGYLHGNGGILSWPGVDPQVFHTIVGPRGILNTLPTRGSVFTNPTYEAITGVKDKTGSVRNGVCDDPPTAGDIKGGIISARFGKYAWATQELNLSRIGEFQDRADPMDLQLMGSPIGGDLFGSPDASMTPGGDIVRNEIANRIFARNVAAHRDLSRQLWIGDPSNDSAGGGYEEFKGLQLLVNTGYVDALNNLSLPSLDSDVKDFRCQSIDSNGTALIQALSYIWYTRNDLAERTGVDPVRFVWAMRPGLFYELTAVWPCAYMTYRCSLAANGTAFETINPNDQLAMRDDMRRGRYLLIEGEKVPVILDDGIPERTTTSGSGREGVSITEGCLCSDIYLLPMSVLGGTSTLYLEYFQYTNPAVEAALGENMLLGKINGAFIEWPRQTNLCFVFNAEIRPRVILRTPWLAGRLNNVQYCPLQKAREPFPDDPYFVNGGNVWRPPVSYYAD